jgi:hypothetical protein
MFKKIVLVLSLLVVVSFFFRGYIMSALCLFFGKPEAAFCQIFINPRGFKPPEIISKKLEYRTAYEATKKTMLDLKYMVKHVAATEENMEIFRELARQGLVYMEKLPEKERLETSVLLLVFTDIFNCKSLLVSEEKPRIDIFL